MYGIGDTKQIILTGVTFLKLYPASKPLFVQYYTIALV